MSHKHTKLVASGTGRPNAGMSMSPGARARMQVTEKAVYKYYNDMGANKGNCTWGTGILAHKGVCSAEELGRKVSAQAVDFEYRRRVANAEEIVRSDIHILLNQAQFDALCSLTYNAGKRGVRDTFAFVNKGDFAGAAKNMSKMIKVTLVENGKKRTVVAPGLVKRRAEESAPFRTESSQTANAQ